MKNKIWVLVYEDSGIECRCESILTFWFNFPTELNLRNFMFTRDDMIKDLLEKKPARLNKYLTYSIKELEEGECL